VAAFGEGLELPFNVIVEGVLAEAQAYDVGRALGGVLGGLACHSSRVSVSATRATSLPQGGEFSREESLEAAVK